MSKRKLTGIVVACTIAIIVVVVLVVPPLLRTPKHALTVSIRPPEAGWVSPSGGEYESGVQVTLTATPEVGYTFDHWSGGASGTTSTTTVTMDSARSLTANFVITLPEGWKIYSNEQWGFRFYCPGDWIEDYDYEDVVVTIEESQWSTFCHNVNVSVMPTMSTLDEFVLATRQELTNTGHVILAGGTDMKGATEHHAMIVTKEWSTEFFTGVSKHLIAHFVANGYAYSLTCSASAETYDSYTHTFETMVDSFVIRKL